MNEKMRKFHDEMRGVAEGKIRCHCGNTNWEQFLYVSGGQGNYTAGCKQCGTSYAYKDGEWHEFISYPKDYEGRKP